MLLLPAAAPTAAPIVTLTVALTAALAAALAATPATDPAAEAIQPHLMQLHSKNDNYKIKILRSSKQTSPGSAFVPSACALSDSTTSCCSSCCRFWFLQPILTLLLMKRDGGLLKINF